MIIFGRERYQHMVKIKRKGIIAGIICFSIFMIPWLSYLVYALVTDITGFSSESIIGTIIGVLVFAAVSSFFSYSIFKKSLLLIIISSACVLAIPLLWYFMPWLP
jgi:hypothetical protein